jgi:hypothetical protein
MVSRGPSRRQVSKTKTIVVASILLTLTGVLVVVFVLRLAQQPNAKVQLGDTVFEVGEVRKLAPPIEQAGPLLFADPLKHNRDLYIQHLGTDATAGWLAFEAHAPGQTRKCLLRWDDAAGHFKDPCSGAVYPLDGKGLVHYPTDVRRKKKSGLTLYVDLRTPLPS